MSATVDPPRDVIRWPQPRELWSLWDMLEISPRVLLFIGERMEEFRAFWLKLEAGEGVPATDEERAALRRLIGRIQELAEAMEMPYSVRNAFDVACAVALPSSHERLHQLLCLFKDETKSRKALVLTPRQGELFEKDDPFGPDVFAKFNDAARDIEEATKCLALERYTAAVFHLMLAMERALRRLAAHMNATLFNRKGVWEKWSVLVSNMKTAIPLQPSHEQDAWTEAHNLLWGVGKVWRNETMHPADAYTDAESQEIYGAVRVFMTHLAPLVT